MSTKPVAAKADEAITALSALSDDATKAVNAAKRTVNGAERTIDKVVHGAQVVVQHKKDEIEEAQHIIAQLSPRNVTPPVEPAAPATDPAPVTEAAPAPAPAPAPAAPQVAETPATPPVTEPVAAPAADGTEALGLPAPAAVPPRRNFWVVIVTFFHNFGWGMVAWILASLFAVLALFFSLVGYDGIFPTRPEVLRVILVILIVVFSFFIGGTIGSALDRRGRPAVADAEVHVVPAVPVA